LVAVDLGAGVGPAGDGQADILSIDGAGGNDAITASLVAGAVSIKGLPYQVSASHADAADTIVISGFDGNDTITASALAAKSGHLLLDGGTGNDKISAGGGGDQLFGAAGNDNLNGGAGNDTITGGAGNDTITGGAGSDLLRYTGVLDGHDVVIGFDGNPTGGQDVLDLDALFDNLGIAAGSRAARVQILDKGTSVEIAVDTDGIAGADLAVATLKTADAIAIGQDVLVGS
jgi:Ca2+-binding RTX toxin-like protein